MTGGAAVVDATDVLLLIADQRNPARPDICSPSHIQTGIGPRWQSAEHITTKAYRPRDRRPDHVKSHTSRDAIAPFVIRFVCEQYAAMTDIADSLKGRRLSSSFFSHKV